MVLLLEILGVLFMLTMMLIMIWSFVIFNKAFGQLRYRNYLLEKINHSISLLGSKNVNCANEIAIEKTEIDHESDVPALQQRSDDESEYIKDNE
ncbi:hypothetical protein [Clostridium oryzae]|uniref:Uncharacterized protein n=1 Tax=Clostridium oryzae TaxID=1450648 RepID=A0A1V4IW44_9CLOT|nr:hypothetical protein [Clostridium oryzae]OPJ64176.1 hypothetical protein CLORY_07410 [Clostridium oryzae]